MASLQELFTKVTGLTYDVNLITDENLKKWLIPDGSMLDTDGDKADATKELIEAWGLSLDDKFSSVEVEYDDEEDSDSDSSSDN